MFNLKIKNEILKSMLLEYLRKAQLFNGSTSESFINKTINSFTLTKNDKKEAKKLQVSEETYLKLLKEIFFEMAETFATENRLKNSIQRKIKLIKLKIKRLEKSGEEITNRQVVDNILRFLEKGNLKRAQSYLELESDKFYQLTDKTYKILADTLQINLKKISYAKK